MTDIKMFHHFPARDVLWMHHRAISESISPLVDLAEQNPFLLREIIEFAMILGVRSEIVSRAFRDENHGGHRQEDG